MTQMDKPVMQHSTRLPKGILAGRSLLTALALLLPLCCGTAYAFGLLSIPGVYIPQTYLKIGAAYSRAIVPGPNGRPVYVEFTSSGKEGAEIGEATGPLERAKVMPAGTYRAYLQRLSDARQRYPESQVMKASEYRSKTFKTVTGETIKKPAISTTILTVLVRADEQLFSTDGKDLLLLELPIKHDVQPSSSSQALLLSDQGDILHQTANTIGYRVGFHGKDGKVNESSGRDRESQIYGPLAGVPIQLWHGGGTITGQDGRYVMPYVLPPCPGFTFEYTTDAYLELYYKRFNPRGKSYVPYYMVRQDWDYCFGLEVYSWLAMGIKATIATPAEPNIDFPLDLMVLDGAATVKGAKLGAKTEYSSETGKRDHYLQQKYDFDGDEKPDWVVPGKKVKKEIEGKEREVFVTTSLEEAQLQGIYLSSRYESAPANTEEDGPDFTRLIDTAPDFQNRALLQTISQDDLRDTDIYVFRESNGQMVAERRGLHESELYQNYSGVDAETGSFRFTIHLRGEKEGVFGLSGIDQGGTQFAKWQSAGGFKEEFQKRNANHLKPGEMVRIIAINRPTGYMGSLRYQLESADVSSGYMGFTGQRIEMSPPNLKVWAERKNKIEQGMTKGEEKKQLIGNEGAGLGSDISIAIYTDWRDADGTPLPEELADYGYTGRLAKIVAANQLAPAGANNLSQFEIKPGQQVQVIQLPEKVLAKQHLYVQVAGQPSNRNPDFSSGSGSGILKYRPSKFVPVMVPLHDEEASELARQAYRKADKENPEMNLKKPEPMYAWQYRPELQFSLYELNVNEVRRNTVDDVTLDVYRKDNPILTSSDKWISALYDLLASEFAQLSTWETQAGRDLVLAFGEQEVKATVGADSSVKFENIAHLGSLDPDDFLSMRLYANNDVGNVLWEWAFEYFKLDTQLAGVDAVAAEKILINADDPVIDLQAILVGYVNRDDGDKKPLAVTWDVTGDGILNTYAESGNTVGTFFNTLRMSPAAGAKASVSAMLNNDKDVVAKLSKFEVVPGAAKTVFVDIEGTASQLAVGALAVKVKAYDKNFNRVADDTPIDFFVDGDARISSPGVGSVGGEASAKIVGGQEPGTYNLTVKVGTVTVVKQFQIKPLQLSFENPPSRAFPNTNIQFFVRVEGADGTPASNVALSAFSDSGIFNKKSVMTSGSGVATLEFFTGFKPAEAEVSVRAGFATAVSRPITIAYPASGSGPELNVKENIILGERVDTDKVELERFDGALLRMPYRTEGVIEVLGGGGSVATVELGTLADPNRQPLLAWMMQGLDTEAVLDAEGDATYKQYAPDALELHRADAENIEFENDGPYAGAGGSYFFSADSSLRAPALPILNPAEPALRFDIKPTGYGRIFKHGALEITADATATLVKLFVDGETHTLSGPALQLAQWQAVGVEYKSGVLSLSVGAAPIEKLDIHSSIPLSYGMSRLTLGGFTGSMSAFKWYDTASQPLVTFAGGLLEQRVIASTGSKQSLAYSSTGAFNVAQAGAKQGLNRVAVNLDGQIQYINLMGLEAYKAFSLQYLNTMYRGGEVPDFDPDGVAFQRPDPFSTFFVPAAYAWTFAEVLDSAVDGMVMLGSFLLPIQEMLVVYEQIGYYLEDPNHPDFDMGRLAIASLGVITGLPIGPTKALGPVVKVLEKFYMLVGKKPKALKSIMSLMEDLISKAKSGNFDKIYNLVPYFLIVAEMMSEREALEFMISSIEGLDDIWAWVDYLSLPANGWEGDGPPPEVELFGWVPVPGAAGSSLYAQVIYEPEPSDYKFSVLPLAYAAKAPRANRAKGDVTGKLLKNKELRALLGDNPRPLIETLKTVSKVLREGGAKEVRKYVMSKEFLTGLTATATVAGQQAVRNLVRGYKGLRVHQMLFISAIAYIEYEVQAENGKLRNKADLVKKIHSKYAMALASLAAGDLEESPTMELITPFGVHNGAQGATFQILVVAYYLATGELEDIEVPRIVKLYKSNGDREDGDGEVFRALRYVDVQLKDSTWVELKSLKRSYTKDNDIIYSKALSPWNMSKDKAYNGTGAEVMDEELKPSTKYHKQFSLDWISKNIGAYTPANKGGVFVKVNGVRWFFHKFRVPANKSASGKQEELSPVIDTAKGGIPERLMKYPLPTNNKAFRYSYGQRITPAQQPMVVREFEATTLLFDKLKQLGKLPEDIKNIADVEL